jgi:hypothetical protein
MKRRYDTPVPPMMRARLRAERRFNIRPRDWFDALRRPENSLKTIILAVSALVVLAYLMRACAPAPAAELSDEPGEQFISPSISFVAPRDWLLVPGSDDLTPERAWQLFAPQTDASLPPIAISVFALPITRQYDELVERSPALEEDRARLLDRLVSGWLKERLVDCDEVTKQPMRINFDSLAQVAHGVAVMVTFGCDMPWQAPRAAEAHEPHMLRHVELVALPGTPSFAGRGQRRLLVVSLTYPSALSKEDEEIVLNAFENVFLSSLKVD